MSDILITDEARQYLEMISPGISQYFDYCGNDGWLVDMDTDAVAVITQYSLMDESLSDTLIRGARTRLGLKPH